MRKTNNEKVAYKMAKLVSDWEVEPEQVGMYFARVSPDTVLTKLQIITNSAILESNQPTETDYDNTLF
jgi:hypothetical protein